MTQMSTEGRFAVWQVSLRRACVAATLSVLLAGGILVAHLRTLAADTGDKKGWSVLTDPRKRAFLIWAPLADGPRVISFACLRDVDSLMVISENVAADQAAGSATLTMSNGKVRYDMVGAIAADPVLNQPTFTADLADDKKAISAASAKLLPVLQGPGPILYKIGPDSTTNDMSKGPSSIPIAGLATPLAKFKSICFGP
jgi:hypothetical protein